MPQSPFAKFMRHDPITGPEAERRNLELARDLYTQSEGEMILLFPRLINDEWQEATARSIGLALYGKEQGR
ncbi:MAG: hypothetical protein CMJ32_00050 [Phycisphaerae bacterium]|nr:hypothetical protein [Phycisphaerae bacterium]